MAGKLPAKMWGVKATNLSNKVLLFGKPISSSRYLDILVLVTSKMIQLEMIKLTIPATRS